MADGGKLAVVKGRQVPPRLKPYWVLVVAGQELDVGIEDGDRRDMEVVADRINAAVEAEVERRLDEITKGVA